MKKAVFRGQVIAVFLRVGYTWSAHAVNIDAQESSTELTIIVKVWWSNRRPNRILFPHCRNRQ